MAKIACVTEEQDEGILIHQIPYSETSRIITWFTRYHGIIRTLAKGVSRTRQSQFGTLDLFYECQLGYRLSSRSGLGTLIHTNLLKNHGTALSSYPKQVTALYCFEVIETLVEKQTPVEDFYKIYLQTLVYLEKHETSWRLVERFERKALDLAGMNQATTALSALRRTSYDRIPKSMKMLESALAGATKQMNSPT